MEHHTARVIWQRQTDDAFTSLKYSRVHRWQFDGGATVAASSSPHSVPLPHSNAANVDPEEAFVAAISSCHMLTFLYLAAKAGFVVDRYDDQAVGTMQQDARGKKAISTVTLAPQVLFSGKPPASDAVVEALHHDAHEQCYIANSVRSEISVTGRWSFRADSAQDATSR
jgi:organic hydroperoxide reductase OsmC/OhrA